MIVDQALENRVPNQRIPLIKSLMMYQLIKKNHQSKLRKIKQNQSHNNSTSIKTVRDPLKILSRKVLSSIT